MRRELLGAAFFVLLVVEASVLGMEASFRGLGDLPGGMIYSQATGISADGTTVVGWAYSDFIGGEGFRWTAKEGIVGLGVSPEGNYGSYAADVSADGSVVVGCVTPTADSYPVAAMWTANVGWVNLTNAPRPSYAFDVSWDGKAVSGYRQMPQRAYQWTTDGRWLEMGQVQGYTDNYGLGMSPDGQVVVGYLDSESAIEAFRWRVDDSIVGLGDLPGGQYYSIAEDASYDGTVIVGFSDSSFGTQAFRWTEAEGMIGLGGSLEESIESYAYGVSADGSVVIGHLLRNRTLPEAFYWTEDNGIISVRELLENKYGLDLTGWQLGYATAISADGLTIAGNGINPLGFEEAWIATVPEPATLLLLGLGAMLLRKVPDSRPINCAWLRLSSIGCAARFVCRLTLNVTVTSRVTATVSRIKDFEMRILRRY